MCSWQHVGYKSLGRCLDRADMRYADSIQRGLGKLKAYDDSTNDFLLAHEEQCLKCAKYVARYAVENNTSHYSGNARRG